MNGELRPPLIDPAWQRLLDAERELEAEMAAAQADVRTRLAQARAAAAAATPDPAVMAALAAAQEQADVEQHRGELVQIAERADNAVRALTEAPAPLIDELARLALGAVLTDEITAGQR